MSQVALSTYVISMNEARRAPLMEALALHRFYDVQIQPGIKADSLLNSKEIAGTKGFKFLVGREMWGGELGCSLAHFYALEAFLKLSDNWALILEDNARLGTLTTGQLQDILKFVTNHPVFSKSPTVVQLYTSQDRFTIGSLVGTFSGIEVCDSYRLLGPTKAYLVNKHAAELGVARSLPIRTPPDFPGWFSITHFLVPNIDVFGVEENSVSEIGAKRSSIVLARNRTKFRILSRKFLTLLGFFTGIEAFLYRLYMGRSFYIPVIVFRRFIRIALLVKKIQINRPLYTDGWIIKSIHERLIKNGGGLFIKHRI